MFIEVPASIQIELSNVCNALCPTCQRNTVDWQALKEMKEKQVELTMDNLPIINVPTVSEAPNIYVEPHTIQKVVESNFFKTVDRIDFVGTIDDPLASPYLTLIMNVFRNAKKNIKFSLHTNGSLRKPEYFEVLASYFSKSGNSVSFSIDGLEDTNHLYRRNCQWEKIIENAKAFIGAGGIANWQYIEFPWNSHQVQQAKELSESLGFTKFVHRKNIHNQWKQNINNWRWQDFLDLVEVDPVYSIANIDPNDTVSCSYQKRRQYHISYDSKLWPCCILNSNRGHVKIKRHFAENFNNRYAKDWNCLKKNHIDNIVAHQFYSNDLVQSWSSKQHGPQAKDRIISCTMSCSKPNTNANQQRIIA